MPTSDALIKGVMGRETLNSALYLVGIRFLALGGSVEPMAVHAKAA